MPALSGPAWHRKHPTGHRGGRPVTDRIGQRYGRLVVVGRSKGDRLQNAQWLATCDCGVTVIVRGYNLANGNTRSCGCLGAETQARNLALGRGPKVAA
jgi:hypothetical protein